VSDVNQYILDAIKTHVWSGFYTPDDVYQMIEDILEEGADEEMLKAAVTPEFLKKEKAEATWPETTDCDRLDDAFAALDANGIISLQNAGMTMSDGESDVGQALDERGRAGIIGYCFYHGQDLERAVVGDGLWLAFGDLDAIPAQKTAVGNQIKSIMEAHGFAIKWTGDPERRICLLGIDWKRRGSS